MIKTWFKKIKKNGKKTRGTLQFSIFRKMFAPLEAKMMKNDLKKTWLKHGKNDKTMKKNEENCNFPFFWKFLHHWKQKIWKMIKNDKNMEKNIKQWKKSRKLAIFNFLENFCATGSKNDEHWWKNDKKMKKWF